MGSTGNTLLAHTSPHHFTPFQTFHPFSQSLPSATNIFVETDAITKMNGFEMPVMEDTSPSLSLPSATNSFVETGSTIEMNGFEMPVMEDTSPYFDVPMPEEVPDPEKENNRRNAKLLLERYTELGSKEPVSEEVLTRWFTGNEPVLFREMVKEMDSSLSVEEDIMLSPEIPISVLFPLSHTMYEDDRSCSDEEKATSDADVLPDVDSDDESMHSSSGAVSQKGNANKTVLQGPSTNDVDVYAKCYERNEGNHEGRGRGTTETYSTQGRIRKIGELLETWKEMVEDGPKQKALRQEALKQEAEEFDAIVELALGSENEENEEQPKEDA